MNVKNDKVPWYVTRKVPPSQVREWLEELKSRQKPRLFTEAQWREILHRWRTEKLKMPNYGNSGRYCPRCGCELRHFYITTDKGVLERAKEDPRIRKLVSGYTCWACIETYFMLA